MKRIEAVITPGTLDTFKAAAPRLGISEFELVEVYRLDTKTSERGKGLYQGCEYRTDLSPRLRVEFVMFDDDVQRTLHRLLELLRPESISVFRLDQQVRSVSSASPYLKQLLPSSQSMTIPEVAISVRGIGLNSRQNGERCEITPIQPDSIRH
jgi:nitrogen regulatory protein P-II 1